MDPPQFWRRRRMKKEHPYLVVSSDNLAIRQPSEPLLITFCFLSTRNRVLASCTTSGLLSFYAPI